MTLAQFYREEAARCRQRAEQSTNPVSERRWQALAADYLRLARELGDAAALAAPELVVDCVEQS